MNQIRNNRFVTQRFNVQNFWVGAYDYYGQIDEKTNKEDGIGRRCWHNGGIEEGNFMNG